MTKENKEVKITKKRKINWVLVTGIVVLLIPVALLGTILLGQLEKPGTVIVEDRFENQLNPAISEEQLTKVGQISVEGMESLETSLTTGTLRFTVKTSDDANIDQIKSVNEAVVAAIYAILPEETYFTNSETTNMYDLEVHTYDFIDTDKALEGEDYVVYTRTGGGEGGTIDVVTQAKDQEVADKLLNPDKGE